MPSPVVALNRAIALGEVEGPGAALEALDGITDHLDTYHLFHAALGTTLRRLGRPEEALAALERAVALASTEADRSYLTQQLSELAGT
jgi:RNA polymerase sigma-70 factor (ECF subfamily)